MNQIILSCNEDPVYSEFWPVTSWAYKKMYPDVKVHLAFLTRRDETDPLVDYFRTFGDVTLFRPVNHIGEFAQAKMIRFLLASMQGPDVCYIDDIDLLPLSKGFIDWKISNRPKDHVLCVGGEVYNNNGCYPISQMTAEGYIWKQILNPHDKTYEQLIEWWDRPQMFDRRERMSIPLEMDKDNYFSDERLLRRLMLEAGVKKFEMPRGYNDFMSDTIDRQQWKQSEDRWAFSEQKLKTHGYLNVHGLRPYKKYEKHYKPILNYINENY